jgi:uncharacterized membrane protein YgcG
VGIKGRRKLDIVWILLGAVVIAATAFVAGLAGRPEQMRLMYVTGAFTARPAGADPAINATETIDWDFGSALGKHGIFRDFPTPYDYRFVQSVKVSSPDAPADASGSEAPVESNVPGGTRVRIGDPSTTVMGVHRYAINWTTSIPGGPIRWNAVGSGWPVGIDRVEIHLVGAYDFENLACVIGKDTKVGSAPAPTTPCAEQPVQVEPGHVVVHVRNVASMHGVQISATLGKALTKRPGLPTAPARTEPNGVDLITLPEVAAIAAALGAIPMSLYIRRRGRERVRVGGAADAALGVLSDERRIDAARLAEMATIEFAPPKTLSPAQGGVVLAEGVRPNHKVAWLLEQAVHGAVDLADEDKRQVKLTRLGDSPDAEANKTLNVMFHNRTEIVLGKYDKSFASGWARVGQDLDKWAKQGGLWDPKGDRRRTGVRLLAVVLLFLSAAASVLTAIMAARDGSSWLPWLAGSAAVFGVGVAALVRSWELRVRTPEGSGLWLQTESFRRFLHESESQHVRQAADLGVLREYTAWAVAVGEADHWAKAVGKTENLPESANAGLNYIYLAPMLASVTSSSSTAPSSSGGGGFSGGSVGGGGGGGGGGGSW